MPAATPSIVSVTTYWCLTAWSGTLTPAMAPIWRDHMPAESTTFSQAMVPASVTTPATRPFSMTKPMQPTPSKSLAPCMRAPFASDWVMSDGLAWPSEGMKVAPTRSSTSISGQIACASAGVRRCMSRPKLWAVVA